MKVQSIKQVLNSVPKRLAAIFGVVAVVLVPLGLQAWGPSRETFTMNKPATYVTFNSITDNPDVGDERNFARVSKEGQKGWTDTMLMEEGGTYYARLYVHNNAAANLKLEATNVRAALNLPIKDTTWGKQFEVNGFISADNAKPAKIWDNIVLKSDKEFHVKVVSAKYYNNIKTEKSEGFDLGSAATSATGAQLGYTQMDGKIPGCLEYSGYVLIKFQPVFKQEDKPGYDLQKAVDKSVAKAGGTINYTLSVKNTGNVDLTNVKISDKLPAYYSEAKETIKSQSPTTGSIVKGGEVTLAKLAVGETATIKISYKIKSDLDCGETTIQNHAAATTDQDQTEDRTDNNDTTTIVTKECADKKIGYDVFKTVDKTVAAPGDTVYYIIGITNTGETELTNAVLTDVLPQYYDKVTGEVTTKHGYKDTIAQNGQIVFDKLEVGETATVKLSYQLKGADAFECGTTQVNNQVSGTTDQDQTEDRTDNNQVTTDVVKECVPVTPVTPSTPQTPDVIAQTGAGEVIATTVALGAIAAALTAYLRSRKLV